MPELARLTPSGDVRHALRSRDRVRGRLVDVRVRDRGDRAPSRVAVVAGRRVGGAVERNRAKRRLRAAVREVAPGPGRDLVLIAGPGCDLAPFEELRGEVERATRRLAGDRHRSERDGRA